MSRLSALERKLLRDLRLMWSQALTIALVVASGVAGFITCLSAVDSLALARDAFYSEGRFAEVFASVKRAPNAVLAQIQALPGVAEVQPTLEQVVRIQVPGSADPVLGQLIGVDAQSPPLLNRVSPVPVQPGAFPPPALRPTLAASTVGQALPAGEVIDALVSRGFAQARGLRPGDTLQALINGRQRTLRVVGHALSPEFIFAGLWGMPDQRGFGIFWVDKTTLAAAYDMQGAFNTVALRLAPEAVRSASEREVIDRLAAVLAPYGGQEPRGREDQTSHLMLANEIKSQQLMGTILPGIFLGVAAFLLNVVVSRLVATQREQIASLKALGYANGAIARHYLQLVLAIVLLGLGLGVALGNWLGEALMGLYAQNFHFLRLVHVLRPERVVVGCGITAATAVLGTLWAILATVRLSPAQAMRPPAPGQFGPTLLERLGVRGLSPGLRMVLRNMERKPLRTGLSIAGVAAAVAIVVLGNFFRDAMDVIVDTTFSLGMRSDVSVWLAEPADDAVRHQIARLPGVLEVESARYVPATLTHGHRRERTQLRALPPEPSLYRIVDVAGTQTHLHGPGLVLTDRLADKLGLRVGDAVAVEFQQGRVRQATLVLEATVREMMGMNAYMTRDALNQVLGDGDVSSSFVVALERGREAEFLAATQGLPRVAGAFSKASMLRNMQEMTARNILIMSAILTGFACVIAVGVVYNNARIALAERAWELASLRVLGFTRQEVTNLLLGEMALSIAIALPLGMWLGHSLVIGLVEALKSDQFFFPVVVRPRTYAVAALAVLVAAAASAWVVRRHIHRLDMVAALKTRE